MEPSHDAGPRHRPAGRLDYGQLTRPVDRQQLDAFITDSKSTNKPWSVRTTGLPQPGVSQVIAQLLPVVIPVAGLIFFAVVGGRSLIAAVWRFTFEAPFPLNLVIVGFVVLILVGVVVALIRLVVVIRSLLVPRWWWEAAYRLVGFAGTNGLRYGHDETASYPGVIFGAGADRTVERRLSTTSGRHVEIGNYRYVVRGDDSDQVRVYGWGYVAIKLDRRLPHLLLDAKANNRSVFGIQASNLPVDLVGDQKLTLGGEFDAAFTLYAPSDYGRDAFQILAPDLMALFIDRLGTFDVEIIDDTMFCYGARFDLLNPATYEWLQELVETVVARTVHRTARYRDDFALLESDGAGAPLPKTNAPAPAAPPTRQPVFAFAGDGPPQAAGNTVAERGRRLRRRTWGFWSIVGLLLIASWFYNSWIAPLFGLPHLDR